MEKRLTADLNVVANSNLEIQLLDGDLNIIQKLDDEPNDVGGLTSAELKAKFDESGNIIKKYINETLIPAVLAEGTTAVRYTPQTLTDAQKAQARANINAAPGGFGLGEGSKFLTSDDDLNEVWENGSYAWDAPPQNAPTKGGSLIPYCSMNVLNKGSDYNTHQIIYTFEGYEIHRYYDGAKKIWSEQAWVNPPMELGTEYRTTEQRNGKAVYKKLDTDGLLKWRLDGDNTWQIDDGQQVMEIDLSDSITMDSENPFVSHIGVGYDKSVGEKIKQAALAGSAKVTVLLKVGVGEPEKVTLPMSGTQSALKDGSPSYGLTGTYVWAGVVGFGIMIATAISDNSCTVVKYIAPWGDKPIYDPADKPDTTPDGAFLRWSGEQKRWVAETVPAAEGGTF